jgi:hypothetical protein
MEHRSVPGNDSFAPVSRMPPQHRRRRLSRPASRQRIRQLVRRADHVLRVRLRLRLCQARGRARDADVAEQAPVGAEHRCGDARHLGLALAHRDLEAALADLLEDRKRRNICVRANAGRPVPASRALPLTRFIA